MLQEKCEYRYIILIMISAVCGKLLNIEILSFDIVYTLLFSICVLY